MWLLSGVECSLSLYSSKWSVLSRACLLSLLSDCWYNSVYSCEVYFRGIELYNLSLMLLCTYSVVFFIIPYKIFF